MAVQIHKSELNHLQKRLALLFGQVHLKPAQASFSLLVKEICSCDLYIQAFQKVLQVPFVYEATSVAIQHPECSNDEHRITGCEGFMNNLTYCSIRVLRNFNKMIDLFVTESPHRKDRSPNQVLREHHEETVFF